MVFAAGLGTRMRHLTDDKPKPMVKVADLPLIDWRLDALKRYGIERVVVNTHYKAEVIEEHLRNRTDLEIIISHENERLETGGGILKSHEYLGDEPIFIINSDVIWLDDDVTPALNLLSENFDKSRMELLLMVHDVKRAIGYHGKGDFSKVSDNDGELLELKRGNDFVFTGLQILNPQIVYDYAKKSGKEFFSLSEIFAENLNNKLYGVEYKGQWLHVDSPESLEEAESFLKKRNA